MKFKIDENLPIEAAALLREAGHDALTVHDQNLRGALKIVAQSGTLNSPSRLGMASSNCELVGDCGFFTFTILEKLLFAQMVTSRRPIS
jgi:uncharacterized protein DUF5615